MGEKIKSPVTITITNKKTRKNPKQDVTESDDKAEDGMKEENLKSPPPTPTSTRKNRKDKKEELNEADDTKINLIEKTQEENKSEQKQPEATQSDADIPPKVSRRGRKPKITFPARNIEAAENIEPVPNEATTSSRRGSLSPTGSNNESLFECLKCGTKIMQTQELVTNHLKRHKYTLDEYIDAYSNENNSDNFSAIILWQTTSLPGEPTPPKRGSRRGGKTPVNISPQDSNTEENEEHEEIAEEEKVKPAVAEEKKSSPFKLLFSTVGDYNNDDTEPEESLNKEEEDPLSMETSAECTPAKESNEVDRETVTSPLEESTPEKVEPDSTTSLEDVFDLLVRKTPRSSGSRQKMPESLSEGLIMKYTDEKGLEVKWMQGEDESEMPELYVEGKLSGKVDLAEVEHALDQDVQIPERFREMLPLTEEKDEEDKRIVLRIKKVKS